MKKEMSPGVMIGVAVVIVGIIGFVAFRLFFTDPNDTPIKGEAAEKAYNEQRAKEAEVYRKVLGQSGNRSQKQQ